MVEFIKSELFNVDLFNLWQLLADVLVGFSPNSFGPETGGSLDSKLSYNNDQLNSVRLAFEPKFGIGRTSYRISEDKPSTRYFSQRITIPFCHHKIHIIIMLKTYP